MTDEQFRYGWQSNFDEFKATDSKVIRERLQAFISDASPEQQRAWRDSIRPLQEEVTKSIVTNALARDYSAILEYMLPMESRRPDVIMLVGGCVMIVELKGKAYPTQADLDQVAAYARDLRNYHRECANRDVHPVLVPTAATGDPRRARRRPHRRPRTPSTASCIRSHSRHRSRESRAMHSFRTMRTARYRRSCRLRVSSCTQARCAPLIVHAPPRNRPSTRSVASSTRHT